jgi:flagellin
MALSILNNISAMTAENQLSVTQANLQKTLTELSSGQRINSGADDAAGLSIANGLQANVAALTQSAANASNGVGLLQTADGALSQVTALLNRAVTLATEASNGGLTTGAGSQASAIQNEYTQILTQIGQIGSTTNFNGENVFAGNTTTDFLSTQASLATTTPLTSGDTVTINDSKTGGTFVFTAGASSTVADLQTAITNAVTAGTLDGGVTATLNGSGNLEIKTTTAGAGLNVSTNDPVLGPMVSQNTTGSANVYLTDGTSGGSQTISTDINALTTAALNLGQGASGNLSSTANAQAELTKINAAIGTIANWRGTIGANINQLNAANNVMNTQVQNLSSAENEITAADIGQTVANMTKYNILEQTGMSALSQSNQAQQAVLKLLQ